MNKKTTKKPKTESAIAANRKAFHDYAVEQRYEAGLVLQGWEVKSLREGRGQLKESYIIVKEQQVFLIGAHFSPPKTTSTHVIADPTRTRKLLLHKEEIKKLIGSVERKGYTLVPLRLFWKNGMAKLEIALAKGKKLHDKRDSLKDRDWQRDKERALRSKNKY